MTAPSAVVSLQRLLRRHSHWPSRQRGRSRKRRSEEKRQKMMSERWKNKEERKKTERERAGDEDLPASTMARLSRVKYK